MLLADVRHLMPKYDKYNHKPEFRRAGPVLGLALHHSATVNEAGEGVGDAELFFKFQTADTTQGGYGWNHGAWHYVIRVDGLIEYALDESLAGYHAGFAAPAQDDPAREQKSRTFRELEDGQFWNNHYLSICLAGDFSRPDARPTEAQWYSLLMLASDLRWRYEIPLENMRGHSELMAESGLPEFTDCPGRHFDLDALRAQLEIETPFLHAEFLHVLDAPAHAPADSTLALSVVLRNAGNFTWLGDSALTRRVLLRGEWLDMNQERSPIGVWQFAGDVRPGQTSALNNLAVRTPATKGNYTLRFALDADDEEPWYDADSSQFDMAIQIEE
ncbi:MAG TPA: peptidoglycan recognition family protein [Anaerolineae bacterium]